MKKTFVLSLILLVFSLPAAGDTIIFKDGMRIDAHDVRQKNGEVQCEIGGIVFGYPKADVLRIEKGRGGAEKTSTNVIEVHQQVTTVVPEKETATRQKDTSSPAKKPAMPGQKPVAPKKKAVFSKKETPVPKKEAAASKKKPVSAEKEKSVTAKKEAVAQKAASNLKQAAVSEKKMPAAKKKSPPGAFEPQYSSIPSFKEIINEDDNNPPAYIKRRRVLLIPRGLTETQIRDLLLSYEKKLRNELNNRKAKYKVIVVWAYDDFELADEGAAGWVGRISNGQKEGKLSDTPELKIAAEAFSL